MPSFALRFADPEGKAPSFGFIPQFGDEAVSLVHVPLRFNKDSIGQICPSVNQIRKFLSEQLCPNRGCDMSYEACGWALKQRGIRPVLKVVLWNLCDRYHPDNGCFPSQETLAEDCEVSRSALNTHLDDLEERGLIAREQRRKAGSNQQERTRYRFAFEPDFKPKNAEKPCPENGHGAVSENGAEPSPENGESRVQNLDSNLVREPVREPVIEREGGRERGSDLKGASHAELIKRVQRFVTGEGYQQGKWPKWEKSTVGYIASHFAKLSPEEQDEACRFRDVFLAQCFRDGVKVPMPVGNYFRDRVWQMLQMPAEPMVTRVEKTGAPPFGPLFGGLRAWLCLQGPEAVDIPLDLRDSVIRTYEGLSHNETLARRHLARKGIELSHDGELIFPPSFDEDERRRRLTESGYPQVNQLHQKAKDFGVSAVDRRFEVLADLCEPVPVGGEVFAQWMAHDEREGWPPLPDAGRMRVVWFPKGGPYGLAEFKRAADAVMMAKERGDEHAA